MYTVPKIEINNKLILKPLRSLRIAEFLRMPNVAGKAIMWKSFRVCKVALRQVCTFGDCLPLSYGSFRAVNADNFFLRPPLKSSRWTSRLLVLLLRSIEAS